MECDGNGDQERDQRQPPELEDQENRRRRGDEIDLDARSPADQGDEREEADEQNERDKERAGNIVDAMERRGGQRRPASSRD